MHFITIRISLKHEIRAIFALKQLAPMNLKLFVCKTLRFVLIMRMRAYTDAFPRMNASVSNLIQAS